MPPPRQLLTWTLQVLEEPSRRRELCSASEVGRGAREVTQELLHIERRQSRGSGCDKKPPGGGPGKWSGDQLLAEAVWCVL